jgi:hypothetical protein
LIAMFFSRMPDSNALLSSGQTANILHTSVMSFT